MNEQSNNYIPGICNINYAEIRKRRTIGFMGLVSLVLLLDVLYILKAPAIVWALSFVPAFLMITGFLQAKNKFCVGYAAAGMRHIGETSEKITDDTAVIKDKQRAKKMNVQVLLGALVIAAVAIFIGSQLQ